GNGSHPAVDIKALKGTPVYAIGNGKVEKVAFQNNGFGNHIVIKHSNFPSFENRNQVTDYSSSYSHLSVISVAEGDIVTRGQKIGEVGDTGLATTNHLHFQIDKADAPWHPYWPFTYKDTLAANTSFYEAINIGLGKENVAKYTVNPMKYIGMYLASSANISTTEAITEESNVLIETPTAEPAPIFDTPIPDETVQEVHETNIENFRFIHDSFIKNGGYAMINIEALDSEGTRVKKPSFTSLTVGMKTTIGTLDTSVLPMNNFFDGKAAFSFTPEKTGQTRFTLILDGEKTFTSEPITVLDSFPETSKFSIEHDGNFEPGVPEEISITALDAQGNRTPLYTLSGSATVRLIQGSGKFSPQELDRSDFQEGVAHITFVADSTDPVIFEVKYLETKGTSGILEYSLFRDVSAVHPSFSAIKFLRDRGIVKGYDDGTFQPNKKVSRAEALKMIFTATGEKITDSEIAFSDVGKNDWYHNYVAVAVELNIVKGYNDGTFRPSAEVSRAEFLKILLTALKVDVDPVVLKKPYSDVPTSAWFAPYVDDAKKRNFIPFKGTVFQPNVKMNRSDVAEMIYRALTAK
ncbi:S-layer homology domain-containing protein, partial [Candidatus Peregrinibacteria bacterium]|nr:S-layer homology domain-containing protein [Candidatus Peregrinibacteria bacterium]